MDHFFSEKEFFLEIFRGKTLCFSLLDQESPREFPVFAAALKEMAAADVRSVVFVHGGDGQWHDLQRCLASEQTFPWIRIPAEVVPNLPVDLWKKKNGIFPVMVEVPHPGTFLEKMVQLARKWRISRMMLIERNGGLRDEKGHLVNFVNFQKLSELTRHTPVALSPVRDELLRAIHALLSHGVAAVGLCRMAELQRELFTYEGSGTFFSCKHYCEVRLFAWDDFPRVAALIHQGVREGYLLPRSEEQISKILLNGFGAFISEHHLAGVCGLFTEGYDEEKAGEVVALYALTRYQGEGIGVRLVQKLKEEGVAKGLEWLFACTQQPRVMDFFQRQGFIPVDHSRIPKAKWCGYDPERKRTAGCFMFPLHGG